MKKTSGSASAALHSTSSSESASVVAKACASGTQPKTLTSSLPVMPQMVGCARLRTVTASACSSLCGTPPNTESTVAGATRLPFLSLRP